MTLAHAMASPPGMPTALLAPGPAIPLFSPAQRTTLSPTVAMHVAPTRQSREAGRLREESARVRRAQGFPMTLAHAMASPPGMPTALLAPGPAIPLFSPAQRTTLSPTVAMHVAPARQSREAGRLREESARLEHFEIQLRTDEDD